MSELRQDPTTFDWIIIAKERSKRPHEFKKSEVSKKPLPDHVDSCPFCPGNEGTTPEAEAVYGDPGKWKIRVIPNKFAALKPEGSTVRTESKLFRMTHGYGRHEVVIETPVHNEFIPFMDDEHVEGLIKAYRDRYHALKKDPNIKIIIIFKNHGEEAGTSLEHPHTQIVASPIVPPLIRRKYEVTTQHFDNTGRNLHLEYLHLEMDEGTRVVLSTRHFTVIHPYASHSPFETWIMPKGHKASFGNISEEEIKDLALVLKGVLMRLHAGLGNPDYNFVIHTAPVDDEHKSYYLWHIQIIPRLTKAAGFELGSGIYINTALPEETAAFMRELKV
jgi:UDPglucose--hexose-1-phosphate uridylyltransferase